MQSSGDGVARAKNGGLRRKKIFVLFRTFAFTSIHACLTGLPADKRAVNRKFTQRNLMKR